MRSILLKATTGAMIAGAAILVAACGGPALPGANPGGAKKEGRRSPGGLLQ